MPSLTRPCPPSIRGNWNISFEGITKTDSTSICTALSLVTSNRIRTQSTMTTTNRPPADGINAGLSCLTFSDIASVGSASAVLSSVRVGIRTHRSLVAALRSALRRRVRHVDGGDFVDGFVQRLEHLGCLVCSYVYRLVLELLLLKLYQGVVAGLSCRGVIHHAR